MDKILNIIGGGMAGSEAAWQAAELGINVVIHEMRPVVKTFAHRTGNLGEMVCSNSFRSDDDEQNAVGLLHWEMRAANGLIMRIAEHHRLPAGGALGWPAPGRGGTHLYRHAQLWVCRASDGVAGRGDVVPARVLERA